MFSYSMSHWLRASINYLLEWTGKMPPERTSPGESGTFLAEERFWIKQIYDKGNVSPGQIAVCSPLWPSPLCIKQSDIWERAEKESEQMKGGAGSKRARR